MYSYYARRFKRRRPRKKRVYRKKMRMIGERVGFGTTKKTETYRSTSTRNLNNNSLHIRNLTLIRREGAGLSVEDINERQRDIINYRGCQVQLEIKNNSNVPCYLNWALISQKSDITPQLSDNSGTLTGQTSVIDFFRQYHEGRAVNFYETGFTSIDTISRPINPDEFLVLKRGKRLLWKNDLDGDLSWQRDGGASNYMFMKKYFPMKRQLRYKGTAATDCVTKVHFVFWFTRAYDNAPMSQVTANCGVLERYTAYWKEPKN